MNKKELEKIKQKALEEHIPIIMDDTLEVVDKILKEVKPKRILEIGAAVGYSAMCFSEFLADGGKIDTIERDDTRYQEAVVNIKDFHQEDNITIYHEDALEFDDTLLNHAPYDCLFIDAAKAQYRRFFEKYCIHLNENGIIVSDNMNFHGLVQHPELTQNRNTRQLVRKIHDYHTYLAELSDYETAFYDYGDGVAITRRK